MDLCIGRYLALLLAAWLVPEVLGLEEMDHGGRTYGGNSTVLEELCPGLYQELWGDDVIVDTKYGELLGRRRVGFPEAGGVTDTVDWFLGVPYAAPPVGEMRFQSPVNPAPWTGVRNATRFGPTCPQTPYGIDTVLERQDEDCLYLNIYAPVILGEPNTTPKDEGLPVYVFIHGGSYKYGSGVPTAGHVLAQYGVIVITINYRLGLLGFMTTLDEHLPGNFGFLDMIHSLKWINENIRNFGGNPDKVTVGGHSAGGPSAALLSLSPLTEGLLHQIILNSGPVLANWAMHNETVDLLKQAQELSALFGCGDLPVPDMVDCMMLTPAINISQDANYPRYSPSGTDLKPRVTEGIIPGMAEKMLEDGSINADAVMTGTAADEWGILLGIYYWEREDLDLDFVDGMDRETFVGAIQHAVSVRFGWPEAVSDAMIQEYTNWANVNDTVENLQNYMQCMGDMAMYAPNVKMASMLHARGIPSYMYNFDHRSALSSYPAYMGKFHYLDLNYIFGTPFTKVQVEKPLWQNYTEEDRDVSRLMMRLFSNFIKEGNPTPASNVSTPDDLVWNDFKSDTTDYLYVSENVTETRQHFKTNRMVFWNHYIANLIAANGSVCHDDDIIDDDDGDDDNDDNSKDDDDDDDGDGDDSDDDYKTEMWIFISVSAGLFLLVIILVVALVRTKRKHQVNFS